MYATLPIAALAVAVVGTLMVRGTLPAPAERDVSPVLASVWVPTSILALLVVFVLAMLVTWVVSA